MTDTIESNAWRLLKPLFMKESFVCQVVRNHHVGVVVRVSEIDRDYILNDIYYPGGEFDDSDPRHFVAYPGEVEMLSEIEMLSIMVDKENSYGE